MGKTGGGIGWRPIMAMSLDSIVPWGRSFDEYVRMFALTEDDQKLSILGCGDGPAAFNAVLSGRGGRVVSCDPAYRFSVGEIGGRIAETYDKVLAEVRKNRGDFVWDLLQLPEELGRVRMAAMQEFLADFEQGKTEGRYVAAELPILPFAAGEFDLALCSHLLFLYSERLSFEFHLASVRELCRVAREVRIFPLVDLAGERSPYVEAIAVELERSGCEADICWVPYEFQRGGNEMLKILCPARDRKM